MQTTPTMDKQYEVDTLCGFWMWKPVFMQHFAKVGYFAASMSFANLMTQTLVHYVNSQVTTLERQFGFSSQQTGIILAANDIGYLVCVLFVGYLATRAHIPRSLGISVIIYGLSGIACALPHFLFGAKVNAAETSEELNSNISDISQQRRLFGSLCDVNNSWNVCQNYTAMTRADHTSAMVSGRYAEISLIIIVVGMALQGFGKAPRTSFFITYVDDNTDKHNTGFYTGINLAMSVLGPAVAFGMGGVFTRLHVTLQATKLTPRHPNWIGAWWLGYLVFGITSIAVAIPLLCFPRRLPKREVKDIHTDTKTAPGKSGFQNLTLNQAPSQKAATKDATEGHRTAMNAKLKFFWVHSKAFLTSLYRLLTNPVYVLMTMSSCCTIFSIAGTGAFSPKYLESMFHLPAHNANFVMAVQTLCTAVVGSFMGGYLSRRLKMTAMKAVKFNIVMFSLALSAQLVAFVFQCDQPTVHNWPSEENICNSGCNCRDNSYFPICGGDGRTYYSPCHAGCLQVEQGVYQNCSCIPGGHASSGTCDYGCSHLYGFAVIMGIRLLTNTLTIIPKVIVCIRCVSAIDRSMALSVFPFLNGLLGWLLAPIVFGNAIDSTCQIWDIKCHTTGRCLLYDNSLFRVNLIGYGTIGVALTLIFLVLAYVYARYTKCLDEVVQDGVGQDNAEMTVMVTGDNVENSTTAGESGQNNSQESKVKIKSEQ